MVAGVVGAVATVLWVPIADPSSRMWGGVCLGGGSLFAVSYGLRLALTRQASRLQLPRPLLYTGGALFAAGAAVTGLLLPGMRLNDWALEASTRCLRLARGETPAAAES